MAVPRSQEARERLLAPRPQEARDRLLALGAESLSTQDLLSVLVTERTSRTAIESTAIESTAVERPGAVELLDTSELINGFGSLRAMAAATARELQVAHGVGRTTALRLAAAFALGRRVRSERLPRGRLLRESAEIFTAFHERLRDLKKERFLTVMLNGKNRVIREVCVSEGILTASLVHPREVFVPAIRESAAGIVLVHNHPSGDPEPSPEDLEVTRRLAAVGELVGIRVLDHVIVGDGRYVSFLERGLLPD